MIEKHIILEDVDPVMFYGVGNAHLQMIKSLYPKLRIVARDNVLRVLGDEEEMAKAEEDIELMRKHLAKYNMLNDEDILDIVKGKQTKADSVKGVLVYSISGRPIKSRSENQQQLIDAYKLYLVLGGMPEAVSAYIDTRSWAEVKVVQDAILQSYSLDFAKHISNKDIPRVFQVWGNLQNQLAREDKKFRYADIQKGARAREYEGAIEWLCLAGLVHRVSAIETPRLPLSAYKKDNAFKLYLNDVGLLGRKFDLDASTILMGDNLFTEFKGVMAENYVLQALVRQYGCQHYYWTSGNTAEVEFLLQDAGKIIPIEVKADKNVTAKSLAYYRKQYLPKLSVRLSALNMRKDDDLLNLPLYLVDKLKMFVESIELNE